MITFTTADKYQIVDAQICSGNKSYFWIRTAHRTKGGKRNRHNQNMISIPVADAEKLIEAIRKAAKGAGK